MQRLSAIMLLAAALGGCTTFTRPAPAPAAAPEPVTTDCVCQCECEDNEPGVILADWVEFVRYVDGLDATDLTEEYTAVLERYRAEPDDVDRLRLSYLLSRPRLPERDVAMSQVLLTQIPADSEYAPLRTLLAQETAMMLDLEAARQQAQQLRSQLDALKGIDADLTRGQEEIEELSQ